MSYYLEVKDSIGMSSSKYRPGKMDFTSKKFFLFDPSTESPPH